MSKSDKAAFYTSQCTLITSHVHAECFTPSLPLLTGFFISVSAQPVPIAHLLLFLLLLYLLPGSIWLNTIRLLSAIASGICRDEWGCRIVIMRSRSADTRLVIKYVLSIIVFMRMTIQMMHRQMSLTHTSRIAYILSDTIRATIAAVAP